MSGVSVEKVPEMGVPVWPVFDEPVRAESAERLQSAFWSFIIRAETRSPASVIARGVARALVECDKVGFQDALVRYPNLAGMQLTAWWSLLCGSSVPTPGSQTTENPWDPRVAACVVGAFVRFGMPLCLRIAPDAFHDAAVAFQGSALNNDKVPVAAVWTRAIEFAMWTRDSPLCKAVRYRPDLAEALLNLPPECGLDVNEAGYERSVPVPAIGFTNAHGFVDMNGHSRALFERLLKCTNRNVLNRGRVYVNCDRVQSTLPDVHLLISNIFRFTYSDDQESNQCMERARTFIALAQPDGSGTDLTGGEAHHRAVGPLIEEGPTVRAEVIWPNAEFRGALTLADTLHHWWANDAHVIGFTIGSPEIEKITKRLATVRADLVQALRRIRIYHRDIQIVVSTPLKFGNLHVRQIHALVSSYLLVPLHDPMQLRHPLVLPP